MADHDNVISIDDCVSCGGRNITTDLGPHKIELYWMNQYRESECVLEDEIEYPVLTCHDCELSWSDWRGEEARDAWQRAQRCGRRLPFWKP